MFLLILTPQQTGMWKKCSLGCWGPACSPLPGEHLVLAHKGELLFLEGEWGGGWSAWGGKRAWEQLHQLRNPTCRKQLAEQRPLLANAPAALSLPSSPRQRCTFPYLGKSCARIRKYWGGN